MTWMSVIMYDRWIQKDIHGAAMRDDALILHIEFCSILNILIINLVSAHHCPELVCIPIPLATLNSFATLNKSPKVMDPFQIKDIVMHKHANMHGHVHI